MVDSWSEQEITDWAGQTFGIPDNALSLVNRASGEFDELIDEVYYDSDPEQIRAWASVDKVLEECADIVIVLTQVVNRLGGNLQDEINKKMQTNSMRTWIKTGDGIGRHQ